MDRTSFSRGKDKRMLSWKNEGAVLLAITENRNVVLVNLYRHGVRAIVEELPSGTMDSTDETVMAAAKRELLEETGYGDGKFVQTGTLSPNTANHSNTVHCFLATDVRPMADPADDDTERIRIILRPLEDVIKMARENCFRQALHTAALFLALDRMGYLQFK